MNIAKRPDLLGARRKQLPFLGPGIFASPGPFSCVETNEEAAGPVPMLMRGHQPH